MVIKIYVYSDVICPWCWLGKRRMEKALKEVPELEADIQYLPFELRPDTPEGGMDRVKYLRDKYGNGTGPIDTQIKDSGKEVGLDYHFEKAKKIPNTFNAHRVIWLARKPLGSPATQGSQGTSVQKAVDEALHEAYFSHGKDIGDKKVLAEVAAKAGLDRSKIERLLNSEEGAREVRELEEEGYNLGISGVPFFIFGDKTAVSGAQPVETFVSILKELLAPDLKGNS